MENIRGFKTATISLFIVFISFVLINEIFINKEETIEGQEKLKIFNKPILLTGVKEEIIEEEEVIKTSSVDVNNFKDIIIDSIFYSNDIKIVSVVYKDTKSYLKEEESFNNYKIVSINSDHIIVEYNKQIVKLY